MKHDYRGTSIKRRAKGLSYNEVSLYLGSFPHILLLLGLGISFVIPRTSLHESSLNRGSTVFSTLRPSKLGPHNHKVCNETACSSYLSRAYIIN